MEEITCAVVKVFIKFTKLGQMLMFDNKCFVFMIVNISHHYVSVAVTIKNS